MSENTEIKLCPCCGSEAHIEISQAGGAYRITCSSVYNCGLTQFWFDELEEATQSWNKRTKPVEVIKTLEDLY